MFNPDKRGIRPEVQAFFEPYFENLYSKNSQMDFKNVPEAVHQIPQTWTAGEPTLATDIFICGSPMDAVAFLHFNYQKFNRVEQLFFVFFGTAPSKKRSKVFYGARYHLLFPNDLLGHVCDLRFACWLSNHKLWIEYLAGGKLKINFRYQEYFIDQQIFTLNRFERKSGYRFNAATHKSKSHNTFFEQLKYGNPA